MKLGTEVAQEEAMVTEASVVGQEEEEEEDVGVETQFGKEDSHRLMLHFRLQVYRCPMCLNVIEHSPSNKQAIISLYVKSQTRWYMRCMILDLLLVVTRVQ